MGFQSHPLLASMEMLRLSTSLAARRDTMIRIRGDLRRFTIPAHNRTPWTRNFISTHLSSSTLQPIEINRACSHCGHRRALTANAVNAASSRRNFSSTDSNAPSTKPPPYRIVFFASSPFSIPALQALHSHAKELLEGGTCTVVTPADKPTGRGQVVTESPFKLAALRANFNVVQLPLSINFKMTGWTLPQELHGKVDVGVVVSFGYMLPASLISLFPCGVINIHPSLLPRYRGSSPIQFSLVQGDRETGVSIIEVHPERLDGGGIIDQMRMNIPRDATFENLSPVLAEQGAKQLIDVLKNLPQKRRASQQQDFTIPPSPELIDPRSSAPRIPKSAGELRFLRCTPELLWRVYSACKGFTPVYTQWMGARMVVVEVIHPSEAKERLTAAQQSTSTAPSSDYFPSFADATALGAGAVFYEQRLAAIGIICASNTLETPSVLYLTRIHLSGKPQSVPASTFASGYLDRRQKKNKGKDSEWRCVESGDEDWWQGKLTTPEREDLVTTR